MMKIITKHIIILNNTTFVIGLPKSYQLIISNIKNVISNDSIATPINDKAFFHYLLLSNTDYFLGLFSKVAIPHKVLEKPNTKIGTKIFKYT